MSDQVNKRHHLWLGLLVVGGLAYGAYEYQEPILNWARPHLQSTGLPLDFLSLEDEQISAQEASENADPSQQQPPAATARSDHATSESVAAAKPVQAAPSPQYRYILKSVALDPFELKIEINSTTVHERRYGDLKQVEEFDISEIVQGRNQNVLSVHARRLQKEKTDTSWGRALGTDSFKVWIERREAGSYYGQSLVAVKGPGRLKPFGQWARMAKSFSAAKPAPAIANAAPADGASETNPEKKSVITFTKSEAPKQRELENPAWLYGRWKVISDTGANSHQPWSLNFGPKQFQVSRNGRTETFEYRSLPQNNRTLLLEAYRGPVVKKYRVETTATYWRLTTPEGQTFHMVRDQF